MCVCVCVCVCVFVCVAKLFCAIDIAAYCLVSHEGWGWGKTYTMLGLVLWMGFLENHQKPSGKTRMRIARQELMDWSRIEFGIIWIWEIYGTLDAVKRNNMEWPTATADAGPTLMETAFEGTTQPTSSHIGKDNNRGVVAARCSSVLFPDRSSDQQIFSQGFGKMAFEVRVMQQIFKQVPQAPFSRGLHKLSGKKIANQNKTERCWI